MVCTHRGWEPHPLTSAELALQLTPTSSSLCLFTSHLMGPATVAPRMHWSANSQGHSLVLTRPKVQPMAPLGPLVSMVRRPKLRAKCLTRLHKPRAIYSQIWGDPQHTG